MKQKDRIALGFVLGGSIALSTVGAFFFVDDILYKYEQPANEELSTKSEGKPIQTLASVEQKEDDISFKVEKTTMVDGGFTQEEAEVLDALNSLWGEVTNEEITKYLDLPNDEFRAETIRRLLPGVISESIKFGIRPGNSLAQAIKEHGWYKEDSKPKTWYFNNAYGIKISSETTPYWDGATEVINTKEHEDGETIAIKDNFRSYPSLWHSSMDHGLLLNKGHYAKYNILQEKDPYQYGRKLGLAGYYTSNGPNGKEFYLNEYSESLDRLFKQHNFDRLDNLVYDVKEIVARNNGNDLSTTGNQIREDEWRPQTKETHGYFVNPSDVKIIKDASGTKEGKSWKPHGAWDLKALKTTQIYSSKSGVVDSILEDENGKSVKILHNDNTYSKYSNLDSVYVKAGDRVSQGDLIGKLNESGQLHFELIRNNKSVNPLEYYNGKQGESYQLKSKSDFNAYRRVLDTVGYYDGSVLDESTVASTKISLRNSYSFVDDGFIEEVPKDAKPVYSPDDKWVSEFKVNLNGLSEKRIKLLEEATSHLGKSYLWAANGPEKFDCSGYTRWVYRKALGVNLPRHSAHQVESRLMEKISLDEAKPGDLVFIPANGKRPCNHIGIFIRDVDNKDIILMHAPRKNDKIKVSRYPKSNGLNFYRLKDIDY